MSVCPVLSLLPLAQLDTLNCLVLRLGGQRVKVSGASGKSGYSVILCVSRKKSKPAADMLFPLCHNTAVLLCLSVIALEDIKGLLRMIILSPVCL